MNNKERAIKVIKELKRGEWEFDGDYITAERNGFILWCGNGGFWTDIEIYGNYFGYFWRHVVYWFGVMPSMYKSERAAKAKIAKMIEHS